MQFEANRQSVNRSLCGLCFAGQRPRRTFIQMKAVHVCQPEGGMWEGTHTLNLWKCHRPKECTSDMGNLRSGKTNWGRGSIGVRDLRSRRAVVSQAIGTAAGNRMRERTVVRATRRIQGQYRTPRRHAYKAGSPQGSGADSIGQIACGGRL